MYAGYFILDASFSSRQLYISKEHEGNGLPLPKVTLKVVATPCTIGVGKATFSADWLVLAITQQFGITRCWLGLSASRSHHLLILCLF